MKSIFKIYTLLFFIFYIILHQHNVHAQVTQQKKVFVFNLRDEISPSSERLVSKALQQASANNADIIVMRLNTFGGMLDAADSIRTSILNCKIPFYVLIEQNAASAGALISIACDSIYMKKGSSIGAASVVNQNGELLPDKYQSYMRSMMRATAERTGRDPKIAEGMVSANNYLTNIADSGRIITLTTNEAIRYKYCNAEADNIEELLQKANVKSYQIVYNKVSLLDSFISFLLNPAVNSILLLLILGGLYFEIQHPGIGLALFVCIGSALLYFAPLYLEGLAANWEILLFVIGVLLILVEIFVIPGFGITGITGIVLVILGLSLSLLNNVNFDFSMTDSLTIIYAFLRVSLIIAVAITVIIFFGGSIVNSKMMHKIVLHSTQAHNTSYHENIKQLNSLIGRKAIANTVLKPSGLVVLDEIQYEAVSEGLFIEEGSTVTIIEVRGNYLVVR